MSRLCGPATPAWLRVRLNTGPEIIAKIHIVTVGSPQCALEQPLEMCGIWLSSVLSLFDDSEGFNQWSGLFSMSFPEPPVKQCALSQVLLYLFIFNIYLLSIINGLINQTILQWKKRMDLYYTFAYLWQSSASPNRGQYWGHVISLDQSEATRNQNPQNGPACCEIYFGSSETKTEFIHFAVMILVEIAFKFGNFMHPES